MENRSNNVLVGGVTLVLLLILVAFIIWLWHTKSTFAAEAIIPAAFIDACPNFTS